jgi:hypothetical protein
LPVFLAVIAGGGLAHADEKGACVDAYKEAQVRRNAGALRQAREALLVCSRDACPAIVKSDCVPWLGEVTRGIASIAVDAVGADGKPIDDVTVSADGELLASRLDGRAIDVDPGERVLRFESAGAPPVELRVLLKHGERDHPVRVTFAGTSGPPPSDRLPHEAAADARPIPTSALVFGGVGVLGVAGFALFGLAGNAKKSDLDASGCYPACSPSDVSTGKTDYIVADVSLGVGVVSLALATYLFASRPTLAREAARFDVRAVSGGALVSRTFTW